MRILLDTHIYLWWLQDHPKLSKAGRDCIVSASEVYVSSASIWEATIKARIGKLEVDVQQLVTEIENSGFQELPFRRSTQLLWRGCLTSTEILLTAF